MAKSIELLLVVQQSTNQQVILNDTDIGVKNYTSEEKGVYFTHVNLVEGADVIGEVSSECLYVDEFVVESEVSNTSSINIHFIYL